MTKQEVRNKNRESKKKGFNIRNKPVNSKELYRRGYNFVVYLEGKMIPFEKVSGLSMDISFETLMEGGRNTVVYNLINPVSSEHILTLERGLLTDEAEFTLYQPGYQMVKEMTIYVLGQDASVVKGYYLRNCTLQEISISDFDASKSELVLATVKIRYETLEEEGNLQNSVSWKP